MPTATTPRGRCTRDHVAPAHARVCEPTRAPPADACSEGNAIRQKARYNEEICACFTLFLPVLHLIYYIRM
jgi:hypothetical protein